MKSNPLPPGTLDRLGDRIEALYLEDQRTLREIAELYACHFTSIRKLLTRRGVQLRGRGRSSAAQKAWWTSQRRKAASRRQLARHKGEARP